MRKITLPGDDSQDNSVVVVWGWAHIRRDEWVRSWMADRNTTQNTDAATGMRVITLQNPKVHKCRKGETPLCILVEEDGYAEAIYDGSVADSLAKGTYSNAKNPRECIALKSPREMIIESLYGDESFLVFETFTAYSLPKAILVDSAYRVALIYAGSMDYLLADVKADPTWQLTTTTEKDDCMFPCDVYLQYYQYGESKGESKSQGGAVNQPAYQYKQGHLINSGYGGPNSQYVFKSTGFTAHKNMCAYDGTKDFLSTCLGISLGYSDRRWYQDNELVVTEGLPIQCTLSVLSELVAPYGVEIDKVWARPGVWYDEFTTYAGKIGLMSAATQAIMEAVPDLPPPRFFVTDDLPQEAMVVMERNSASIIASGHATFKAPRDARPGDWLMALSYRRKP